MTEDTLILNICSDFLDRNHIIVGEEQEFFYIWIYMNEISIQTLYDMAMLLNINNRYKSISIRRAENKFIIRLYK
jgi:hypothetical protein